RQALDAVRSAVAHLAAAARRSGRDRAVGRRAGAAFVGGAVVTVDGQIRIVVGDLRVAGAVALHAFAVERGRIGQLGAGGREAESANAGGAGPRTAGGVAAGAVSGDRAADALAVGVAVVGAAAVRVRRHLGVRGHAGGAEVVHAGVAVVGQVGVVVRHHDAAVGGALAALAVADRLHGQDLAGGLAHAAADAGGTGAMLAFGFDTGAVRREVAHRAGLVGETGELAVLVHEAGAAGRALAAVAAAVDARFVAV